MPAALNNKQLINKAEAWFATRGWQPFPFQRAAWREYLQGQSGLVNAPTGSGKTYSLVMPILLEALHEQTTAARRPSGLRAIWLTPIRALTREIQRAAQQAADELGLDWTVAIRSGDTSSSERAKQLRKPPDMLITTPESLHLLLSSKDNHRLFGKLRGVVADEWHELIGSKRGVMVELALMSLRARRPDLKVWGISATIGNLQEAMHILLGQDAETQQPRAGTLIRADINKRIEQVTIIPDEIETFPWAGHLGISLLDRVLPIIHASGSTLIFTNTRSQCEIWYQRLLDADPELAGLIAMHHGSLERKLRDWVENALHDGQLKAVVCTSSLDLGVDFRPVETIIQIGSPKGVARFLQRAGRSGHQPGATSIIHLLPTHSLELIEASALRAATQDGRIEDRLPYIRSFDLLIQYLVTLAVGGGFRPAEVQKQLKTTFAYASVSEEELAWCLDFITTGGNSLGAYDEYHKVIVEDGVYTVRSRRIATMHRLSIGAITTTQTLRVKYVSGGMLGTIEEYWLSQLKPGDNFWFAGRNLELVRIRGMEAQVRRSRTKKGKTPSWLGSRMDLSSHLSAYLRRAVDQLSRGDYVHEELAALDPLVAIQAERSAVPAQDQFLIEYFEDREGYHLLMYPFEGRAVHEGLSALIAYRLGKLAPLSFTISMNDYGFELLSDQPIPIEEALGSDLFNTNELIQDIQASINAAEMAGRRFRDICSIAGLTFRGYPGREKRSKHLQSSANLFFEVFSQYEPDNLLLLQAYEEVMTFQLQESRMRRALDRINGQYVLFEQPGRATPFAFSLMVDRLRQRLSTEKLADRIKRMKVALVK